MCEFCDALRDDTKEMTWNVRSTMADDNICEFINEQNCSACDGCHMWFDINKYNWDDNIHVGITYNQQLKTNEGKEVIIRPFSETMQYNYCPVCGKQISKEIKPFDKYYGIEINDKEDN